MPRAGAAAVAGGVGKEVTRDVAVSAGFFGHGRGCRNGLRAWDVGPEVPWRWRVPVSGEAEILREQAERCLRLARASMDKTVVERLTELAAEYLERAHAVEGAPTQQPQSKDDDRKE